MMGMWDFKSDIWSVDIEKVNPAAFAKEMMERAIPEHLRRDDWEACWQQWIDYCEQPEKDHA